MSEIKPDFIGHAAAQPSHDLPSIRPIADFEVNANDTQNLLEAARQFRPEAPFTYMCISKAYGDAPNKLNLIETETSWEYAY